MTHALPAEMDDPSVAHTSWWDGLLSADLEALNTLLADDMTFHSPYGTTSTKAAFIENIRSGRLRYHSIEDDEPVTQVYGQTAIVTGSVAIRFQWDDQSALERLYYTAVYGWISSQWHMLAWQSTMRADEG